MDPKYIEEELIRLGYMITRLRQKEAESLQRLHLLLAASPRTENNPDEEINQILGESLEKPKQSLVPPRAALGDRRSAGPEGPPLNRRVLEFLRSENRPCTYQDVSKDVAAHPQSIQNALRDLSRRGYAVKLERNMWVAADPVRGGLTVVKTKESG